MTFHPHPATVLRPSVPRHPLATLSQRREWLSAFSPDVLLIIEPTREFLAIPAEVFLEKIVRGDTVVAGGGGIGATLMVEGPSFTFGRGAKGTVELLEALGAGLGFGGALVPTPPATLCDKTLVGVSSSLIRWLIERGRVVDAAHCLGRPYALAGTVAEGAKRGRTLGFPTANLQTGSGSPGGEAGQLIPAPGIYAGRAVVNRQSFAAAISVGDNPTFADSPFTVEAHLLDFAGDLYGRAMSLEFHQWIRDMLPFSGPGPLVEQIRRDIEWTRAFAAREA